MPVHDQNAGRAFVWLITSFLCFSLVAGGICLSLYLIYPPSQNTNWLPLVGVILVAIPWIFWFLTCMYRLCSRVCGRNVGIGGGGGGGGGGSGNDGNFSNAGGSVADNNNIGQVGQASCTSVRSNDSDAPLSKSMAS